MTPTISDEQVKAALKAQLDYYASAPYVWVINPESDLSAMRSALEAAASIAPAQIALDDVKGMIRGVATMGADYGRHGIGWDDVVESEQALLAAGGRGVVVTEEMVERGAEGLYRWYQNYTLAAPHGGWTPAFWDDPKVEPEVRERMRDRARWVLDAALATTVPGQEDAHGE